MIQQQLNGKADLGIRELLLQPVWRTAGKTLPLLYHSGVLVALFRGMFINMGLGGSLA